MDGISGSANLMIESGMAMSQVRTHHATSVSVVKKGLAAQAQAAMVIDTVQQIPPPSSGGVTASQSHFDVTAEGTRHSPVRQQNNATDF